MPWSYELWDYAVRIDPERCMGTGAAGGALDMLLSWWALFSKR